MNVKITGTGCYIPTQVTTNSSFSKFEFLNTDGSPINYSNEVIIEKFKAITGIENRRYVKDNYATSDIAFFAAEKAIEDAKTDKETIDYIIVAHNFGDIKHGTTQSDAVPSIASRVKQSLKIKNPRCVAYDVLFGCPGWIEGVVQAQAFIKAGMAKKCLVIGAETLSRVIDIHDRDSMIYSDGAGATILEATPNNTGILSHLSATYAYNEADYLFFGKSYNQTADSTKYIKMYGRKIYEFAVTHVPQAMKDCLDQSNTAIEDVKKIFIHQANEKMDEAILKRFYRLYSKSIPEGIMPMNIHELGNSSVATIPTLFDSVKKGMIENQEVNTGDIVMFASVGAGMNINAITYKI
ncbi:ketoacyl-ACP synthase III [Galbibacter orientalis]|uniref:3-oxoacyl-ACP synthase III family protein n=1 Tax=Galbibacter orientalis TaxID=453852 RepID=UPI0030809DC2